MPVIFFIWTSCISLSVSTNVCGFRQGEENDILGTIIRWVNMCRQVDGHNVNFATRNEQGK